MQIVYLAHKWRVILQRGMLGGLVLSLLACATPPPTKNGKLIPPAGQAYAILATTYQRAGSSVEGEAGAEISDGSKEVIVQSGASIVAPDDMPNADGGLHAIALDPGKYRIVRIFGSYQGNRISYGVGFSTFSGNTGFGLGMDTLGAARENFTVPVLYEFEVAAGEVVYIGDAHIKLDRVPSAALRDESERDFFSYENALGGHGLF